MDTSSPLLIGLRARGLKLIDLAKRASVNKATVTRWAQKRVPSERVLQVEDLTGIPRHELRPDIFGTMPVHSAPLTEGAEA